MVIHPPNSPLGHTDEFYALHPGGANVLMGDGSVRFVKQSINLLDLGGPEQPQQRGGDRWQRLLSGSAEPRRVGPGHPAAQARVALVAAMVLALAGCSGEPSERELKNRRELEALLTAVSLKNKKELDRDAERIEDRHTSGELSDAPYRTLQEIVKKARAGDWAAAEKQAYEFRESSPFFR